MESKKYIVSHINNIGFKHTFMIDKDKKLLQEFLDKGKLRVYKDFVKELILLIKSNGFKVSCRYDCEQSITDWTAKHVRISLKKEPFEILCDLFHEYGHILSGQKKINLDKNVYSREDLAWNYAFIEFLKHDELLSFEGDFNSYKIKCLKSYKID